MNKPCVVIISGRAPGENTVDIEVPPGSTALDVLTSLGLDRNWTLCRATSNQIFAHEEEIYTDLEPGIKLRAAPVSEVGVPLWLERFLQDFGLLPRPQPPVRQLRRASQMPRRSSPRRPGLSGQRITVARDQRSLYEVRGWRRQGMKLVGAYRLGRLGAFAGEIDLSNPYVPQYFITSPPQSVLTGSHQACFRKRNGNMYAIHFRIASPDIDAGIIGIEKLLAASLSGAA